MGYMPWPPAAKCNMITNKQTSQALRSTSLVHLSDSRRSQSPLKLSKVLSDAARAFSGAPESTCSCGGAFKMLQNLTYPFAGNWVRAHRRARF